MARKNENLVLKYIYSVLISHLLVISRSKRSIRKWNRRMSNFLTHIYIAELAGINYEQMIILFEYFWGSGQSLCLKSVQFFLVHIFLYSDWIQENTDQKQLHIWTLFTQSVIVMFYPIFRCKDRFFSEKELNCGTFL